MYGRLPSGSWIFGVSMFHGVTDGFTFTAPGIAVAMAVPDERQAGAQGVMGAAQALTAGISAIAIGSLYQGSGRAAAYGAAALGVVLLVVVGMTLAARFWRANRHQAVADAAGTWTTPDVPTPPFS